MSFYLSMIFFSGMFGGVLMLSQLEYMSRLFRMNVEEAYLVIGGFMSLCFIFGVIAFAYAA